MGDAPATYKSEVVFGIVCPLGTRYERAIDTLQASLTRFGYSVNLVRLSDGFKDLLTQLELPLGAC